MAPPRRPAFKGLLASVYRLGGRPTLVLRVCPELAALAGLRPRDEVVIGYDDEQGGGVIASEEGGGVRLAGPAGGALLARVTWRKARDWWPEFAGTVELPVEEAGVRPGVILFGRVPAGPGLNAPGS
jgi:hypothetical protein